MIDLVNISVPNAAGYAVLGYLVVFLGLVMLMLVIFLMGRIMTRKKANSVEIVDKNRWKKVLEKVENLLDFMASL